MEANSALTRKGESIGVFPVDNVALIFSEVAAEGFTTVTKSETRPEPPKGFEVEQYYDVRTTAKFQGTIEIRIICASNITQAEEAEKRIKLLQWNGKATDITARVISKHNLVIGEARHLSIFGVTRASR